MEHVLCESDETFTPMVAEKLPDGTTGAGHIFLDKINNKPFQGLLHSHERALQEVRGDSFGN